VLLATATKDAAFRVDAVAFPPGGRLSVESRFSLSFSRFLGVPGQHANVAGFADEGGIDRIGLGFSPTPEPATLLIMGTGAAGVGLGLARWLKRRRVREHDQCRLKRDLR
jgi:hypothetical protein